MTLRTRSPYYLAALLLAVAGLSAGQQPAAGGVVVFEGARLIVGDGSTIDNGSFIVENSRITRVGRRADIQPPNGATRVDLAGKTVMPAIVDGHSHFGYTSAKTGTTALENYTREHLIESLQRSAYYGIGVTMSMGNDGSQGEMPWTLQDEIIPNAARWRTAGPGISAAGGGQGGVRKDSWTTVKTEAEARKAVQALAPHKPTLVKIWVDDRDKSVTAMSPALYGAVIDEAHKHNLRVAAHIVYLKDAKELLTAGLDGFAHSVREKDHEVDDEFIAMLKKRPNVFMTPLLPDNPARSAADDIPWLAETLPPSEIQRTRDALAKKPNPEAAETFAKLSRNLAKVVAAGVKIGLGTDTGNRAGYAAHTEMWDMVAAGMTPSQALIAGTRNMAEILRLDDLGAIAAGKSADFIVLDANPLENIKNTKQINKVYLRGKEVDRAGLRKTLTAEASQVSSAR